MFDKYDTIEDKDNLQNGDFIIMRDAIDHHGPVFQLYRDIEKETLVDVSPDNSGYFHLDSFDDDMTFQGSTWASVVYAKSFDIVKVYRPGIYSGYNPAKFIKWYMDGSDPGNFYEYQLIFDREGVVEMTLEEIQNKLGIEKIKVVAEHE